MSTRRDCAVGRAGGQQARRPMVFLDVDGVVNRFPTLERIPRRKHEFDDLREAKVAGFPITFSPEMGRRLAALEADIHWLTTWEGGNMANRHIAPLFGWEPLPTIARADHDKRAGAFGWWKSSAVKVLVAQHRRPFVWLDDELAAARKHGQIAWLRRCGLPHLLVSPELGLLPRHLDRIEAWIASLGDEHSAAPAEEG